MFFKKLLRKIQKKYKEARAKNLKRAIRELNIWLKDLAKEDPEVSQICEQCLQDNKKPKEYNRLADPK